MNEERFKAAGAVTLVGGGRLSAATLHCALSHAPRLLAADGGAISARALGHLPELIIGDLDSLGDPDPWRAAGVRVIGVAEQETTDFAKCLARIDAPLILGVGFLEGRIDHVLATLSVLATRPESPVVLIGEEDICLLAPLHLTLTLAAGTRVSLWPIGETTVTACAGLVWPASGLTLSPTGRTGTSNAAAGGPVTLGFDRRGVLLILPVSELATLLGSPGFRV